MPSGYVKEGVTLGSHVSSLGLSFVICNNGTVSGEGGLARCGPRYGE